MRKTMYNSKITYSLLNLNKICYYKFFKVKKKRVKRFNYIRNKQKLNIRIKM